jgi:translocation and assembly module TamA
MAPLARRARVVRRIAACAVTAALGILPLPAAAAAFLLRVDAPEPLRTLLATHLDLVRTAQREELRPAQLERALGRADDDARALLATEGYFTPVVDVAVDDATTPPTVVVKVDPGPVTKVRSVDIRVDGPLAEGAGADARRIAALRDQWSMDVGAPFRQEDWDTAKGRLLRALLVDRYPFARLVDSRAEIDPDRAAAVLELRVDSGPLVRFGPVQVTGLARYPEDTVRNVKPFGDGEPYRQELLLEFQSRLQGSGFFDSVVVTIGTEPDAEGVVPLLVEVAERRFQELKLGVGFSTNTGARVSAEYWHNQILGYPYRLHGLISIQTHEQVGQIDLLSVPDEQQYAYVTQVKAKRTDLQGLETETLSASFGRVRSRLRIDTGLYGQIVYEAQSPSGAEDVTSVMAAATYSWTYRAIDSFLYPTRGYIVNVQGGGGVPLNGDRDSTFVRLYAKGEMFLPVGEHQAILRGEAGRVFARTRVGIPQDFVFRTGGDQSVRGYDYEELGVKDGDAIVGGRYLLVGGVEFVYRVLPEWGLAAFVDAGNAADSLKDLEPAYGVGAGVRWRSPVGPIAADLAYGERFSQWRLHLSLGFVF